MPTSSKYKVRESQSLFDIAIQEAGTIEAFFEVAEANKSKITSLSEPLIPGNALIVDTTTKNKLVSGYFAALNKQLSAATKRMYVLIDSEGYPLQDINGDLLMTKEY